MTDPVQRMSALTDSLLNSLSDLALPVANGAVTKLNTEDGECFGVRIFASEEMRVARWFGTAGAKLDCHAHSSHEHAVVVSGKLKLVSGDVTHILTPGLGVYSPPGEPHSCEFLENSWVLSVTIPPDPAYPV